ncbi:NTP transferase domain-containing protein [Paenibacillus sp. LMG 31460]|uniref:NTP transferase domain-containing protein n=2 Tax=Paenibacillus germinis TaxID=2654979 RepID=A0ABX1Z3F0_9BACL|nr:NTP transferase domain-containing protein [Paenibacillus germinis]
MSGFGNRFLKAGYTIPKSLIEIDGIPMIEHVVNMFPGESKFTFICNEDHLKNTDMEQILTRIAPMGNIVKIPPHKKGPVYAVSFAYELLDDEEEVIVNYCDFSCYWDYEGFLRHTRDRQADGALPSYKHFHPHMLGKTNYAFMRDDNQWMLEIKEKEPFTDNRMNEYASSGTYYFKKGSYVKKYFNLLMEKDIHLNDEFYVSLVYNLLVQDGLRVSIYEIQHMLQWGTPEDVAEYNEWSHYFANVIKQNELTIAKHEGYNLIPLAGAGSRFAKEGYTDPKPLIEVSGKPMVIQAAESLPNSEKQIFVCLDDHLNKYPLKDQLIQNYPDAKIVSLNEITEGQACTCVAGLAGEDLNKSLMIGACDNGMIYDHNQLSFLFADPNTDAIVWTFRNHISSQINPQMYGWVGVDGQDNATKVSVKIPISDNPKNDHAVVGSFFFKKAQYLIDALTNLKNKNIRVNGEFYVDSTINELIEMGLKVKVLETSDYIGWGTPNDYQTFVYWQSFFHKCNWHPYDLKLDPTVAPDKLGSLALMYTTFKQDNQ